jgi:DNA mismatch repair protein MSH2
MTAINTVATILVHRPERTVTTDPFGSQRVGLVVWICDDKEWRYHRGWDHGSQNWHHLTALLQQLDTSAIHVATAFNGTGQQAVAWEQHVQDLVQHLEATFANEAAPSLSNAPAALQRVQFHGPVTTALGGMTTANILSRLDTLQKKHATTLDTSTRLGLALALSQLGQWSSSSHDYTLRAGTWPTALYLDHATAAASLHLWPPREQSTQVVVGGHAGNNSLFGLFSTRTKMGARLLENWLYQPSVCLATLQSRQAAVTYLLSRPLRDALRGWMDVPNLAWTLASFRDDDEDAAPFSSRRALQALYELYLVAAHKLPPLLEAFDDDCPELLQSIHEQLSSAHAQLHRAAGLAEAVLDLDLAPREYVILPAHKPELHELQEQLRDLEPEIQKCQADMNQQWAEASGSTNSNAVKLELGDNYEWQFRLTDTNASKILQNQLRGKVEVYKLLKNGVYFSNAALRQLAAQKRNLMLEYDAVQRTVVRDAMAVAASYQQVLLSLVPPLAQLDVLAGFAHFCATTPHPYCCPTLTDSDAAGHGLVLQEARHACVELQEHVADGNYIPNPVDLRLDQSSFLLVTGPNMGGKSTYIRSLGSLVVLAQIGMYVPCTSATMNLCHAILPRVGAGDRPEQGVSTFMAEMLESCAILQTATRRSLIIIDELGRGTSTFDGYGLARAISEHIINEIQCLTVFATHFHELTALEQANPVVRNFHVTAKKGEHGLVFLYEVRPGPCLESFGIQVAEMANVPKRVIVDAKRKAAELERFQYRSWSRRRDENKGNMAPIANDAEEDASAIGFVDRFRQLPLNTYTTDEEKWAAVHAFLLHEGVVL